MLRGMGIAPLFVHQQEFNNLTPSYLMSKFHLVKKLGKAWKNRQDFFHNGLADMSEWHYEHSIAADFDIAPFRNDYSKYWAQLSGGRKVTIMVFTFNPTCPCL